MTAPRLALIAAVAKNGVIGRNGQLPWHLPNDLKHFKQLTMRHPILMGRRTFESIGKPLPGRRSIVISTTAGAIPGAQVVRSLDEAIEAVANTPGPAFIIGGAVLYTAALPRVEVLHLTELDDPVGGDAVFPPFDKSDWQLVSETRHERDDRHAMAFRFCEYRR